MTLLIPPPLKKGDTIGVFAPSSYVERTDIESAAKIIEAQGYKVFIHPQTYERHNQSAGNHLQKSLAFQGLWQRPDISALWAAGGGNRALHLLDTINFERLKSKPKHLIGFSDVTALLNAVYANTGIQTIHGPVFKNLTKYKELPLLLSLLEGKEFSLSLINDNIHFDGKSSGRLIGGNLSIFHYLPNTLPDNFSNDCILFLEDCNEEFSKIDRMFLHLKRTGFLSKVRGLLLGQFSNLTDSGRPFGFTFEDIINEYTEDLGIPVLKNLPFGHGADLYPLPVGKMVEINTEELSFRSIQES